MQSATFASGLFANALVLRNIRGIRVTYCLVPRQGFQGQFYVYFLVRHSADAPLPPVPLEFHGQPIRGTLSWEGDLYSNYTFHNMDLISSRVRTTERERMLLLEFRCAREVTDDPDLYQPPTLDFAGQEPPEDSGLRDDYKFAIDGGKLENLAGYDAIHSVTDSTVVRFQSFATDVNHSFLARGIAVHGEWARKRNDARPFKAFKVNTSQYSYPVRADNLQRLYVSESSGALLDVPHPGLEELIMAQNAGREFARISLASLSDAETLAHSDYHTFVDDAAQRVIQTATFVFRPNTVRAPVIV